MRLFYVVLLHLSIVTGLFAQTAHKAEERMRFGDGLYGRQLFDMAIKEYEALVEEHTAFKGKDLVLFRLGECYRRLRKVKEADQYYVRLLGEHPDSPKVYAAKFRRGELLTSIGQNERAAASFEALIVDKKTPPEIIASALYYQGFSLKELKKHDASEQAYAKLVESYPSSPYASFAGLDLANLQKERGRNKQAEALYRAIMKKPATRRIGAEAVFQLADMFYAASEFTSAAETYQILFEVYPDDRRVADGRLAASWSFYYNGQHKLALALADEQLGQANLGNKEEWLYLKANALRNMDRETDAHESYGQLLKEFPTRKYAEAATYEKALMAFRAKNYTQVIQLLQGFVPVNDILKDSYWLQAEAHVALEDASRGHTYYEKIMKEFPDSDRAPQAYYRRAELFQAQNQWGQAADSYLELVKNYPKDALASRSLFAAASSYALVDRTKDAVSTWARLIEEYPEDALVGDALFRQGMGELKLNRETEALKHLTAFTETFPSSSMFAEANYWIAVLLEKQDDPKQAERRLLAALEKGGSAEIKNKIKYRLAAVLQRQGKNDEAADFIQQLLKDKEGEEMPSSLLDWLARHRIEQARFKEAAEVAKALSTRAKEEVWKQVGWYLEGRCLAALKQPERAMELYRKSAASPARSEEGARAAMSLGFLYIDQKKVESAVNYLELASSWAADPKMADIRARCYYGLGLSHEQAGTWDKAASFYYSVAILFEDPKLVPECLYRAAMTFGKAGKPVEQRSAAKELLDRFPESTWAGKVK